jgi:hypothetical protein
MEKHQSIISYLLTLLLILILLKIFGIINIHNSELLSYVLIFGGLSYVFHSFGNQKKLVLFTSTIIFLIGISLFIFSNFEIIRISSLIVPSSLIIIGVAFIMTYLDGHSPTFVLVLSLLLISCGIITTITRSHITFNSFLSSLGVITLNYWPVIIIFAGVLIFFRKVKF